MSTIWLPKNYDKTEREAKLKDHLALVKEIEEAEPNWEPYMGCNHNWVDNKGIKFGGGIRLGYHQGKPLSKALWMDLVHRLCVHSLWIIRHNEGEWCLGRSCAASVYLDENNNVRDIYYCP
jgi:hypothetical protein